MARPTVRAPNPSRDLIDLHADRGAAITRAHVSAQRSLVEQARTNLGRDLDLPANDRTLAAIRRHVLGGQGSIHRDLSNALAAHDREARVAGLRGLSRELRERGRPTPRLDDHDALHGLLGAPSRLQAQRRRTAVVGVNARTRRDVGTILTRTAERDGTRLTNRDLLERVERRLIESEPGVRRIAETELSQAYNGARENGLREAGRAHPDLMCRWVERVSEASGRPLDKRVGEDSIELHGQVVRPGELFDLLGYGDKISAPPNRPHCRAVLAPYLPGDKGVIAWRAGPDGWKLPVEVTDRPAPGTVGQQEHEDHGEP